MQITEALSRLYDWKHDRNWCDSTIVLSWIATEASLLKTFVSNRVAEIQRITNSKRWSHVKGSENPADIVSRGMSLNQLTTAQLWWNGPPWLGLESKNWPVASNVYDPVIPELKTNDILCVAIKSDWNIFDRFSSYTKLLRVVAYCLRFVENLKGSVDQRGTGPLSVNKLDKALLAFVNMVKTAHFACEIRDLKRKGTVGSCSKILSLNPFLDNHDILRVGDRLKKSKLHYEYKHPNICYYRTIMR